MSHPNFSLSKELPASLCTNPDEGTASSNFTEDKPLEAFQDNNRPSQGIEFTDLSLETRLGDVPSYNNALDIAELGCEVARQFETHCLLPGILIYDGNRLLGIISRRKFYEFMSLPYSLELFPKRPLKVLWQKMKMPEPQALDASISISEAAQKALQRSSDNVYEPILIKFSFNRHALLDIHTLLLAQNYIHELALQENRRRKQELLKEKELAQITLKSIADGVITTNSRGQVKDINSVAERLTEWSYKDAVGVDATEIFRPIEQGVEIPQHPIQAVLTRNIAVHSQGVVTLAKGREELEIEYSASPISGKTGALQGVILVFRDVSQQRSLSRQIHWQASHDALTGLINRPEFEKRLVDCIGQYRDNSPYKGVLAYLDLDRFKVVNDTCGHLAGDELLRQISHLMQNSLREEDDLARLGGDEFGILLHHCDLSAGRKIIERVYQNIQNFRFFWDSYSFTIGVSIGLTEIDGTNQIADVIRQADTVCYVAKNQGRNQICAYSEFTDDDGRAEKTRWLNCLTDALSHSKFRLFQQKIFAIQPEMGEQEYCSEILIRLPHPVTQDWLSAGIFLAEAERYNLMTEIDAWVIREFCRQYHQTACLTPSGLFAINLSGSSLNDARLNDFIQSQFSFWDIPPEKVCFEITETIAITNLSKARSLVQDLKGWGCRFALDDFGSGMSSFNYLRSLPVDYVKIDGSLIRDVLDDKVAREMVAAISRIAHEMQLKTIAEWVEDEPTTQTLKDLGIDYAQGFGLHAPEPLLLSQPCRS